MTSQQPETAQVLAEHQRAEWGMGAGTPDACRCGAKTMYGPGEDDVSIRRDRAFAAHQAEMLAAAKEPPTSGDDRCPFQNAHYLTNRADRREDGWRCGKEVGHINGHFLYSADGETVLDTMGPWVLPFEHTVVSPAPTEGGAA